VKPGSRSLRRERIRIGIVIGSIAVGLAAMFACAAQPSLSAAGGECFAATDCVDGLVCVPQRDGSRLCSDDLSQVAGHPPPEGGGAMMTEAGGDGPREANPSDSPQGQDTSMPDTSMPDTSMPPLDAGDEG
jgi:hypothetical protein